MWLEPRKFETIDDALEIVKYLEKDLGLADGFTRNCVQSKQTLRPNAIRTEDQRL